MTSAPRRDPRYDILFEPVRIGHLTAKNRFYQPPHCNGMGWLRPRAHAAMRGMKAEGGWAIVNNEHTSIHHSSDLSPEVLQRLWDDKDIPALALMCEAVHAHGALAGVQLAYSSYHNANRESREPAFGPTALPIEGIYPMQVRAMDKSDFADVRRWWKAAAVRSRTAGFDIINVDANFTTNAFQFLSPRNRRTDEYGGSLENRVRLLRELTEVTREAVDGACAVSIRLILDEMAGPHGLQVREEGHRVIELLDPMTDLWDIVIGEWADDSPTSRFAPENQHEPYLAGIKALTRKPVVGVGRFTSPDTMASLIKRGVLDMIGATRPSIADPFLPSKIEEGRVEDIRECIGCNICVSSHFGMTHLRCTQNPTMGEEWRKGWHPERMQPRRSEAKVLVVGAGPAGLEAARALGARGYAVSLADRRRQLGGRVTREAALPGLGEWLRVRDWRLGQIRKLDTVELFPESKLDAAAVLELGHQHVVIATGSRWRGDGVGRAHHDPIPVGAGIAVLTPDDVMDGSQPQGEVLVYDDDHYYIGGVVAEALARGGARVTLVTPAAEISAYGEHTLEWKRVARRLDGLGVAMITHHKLAEAANGTARLAHTHTGRERSIEVATVVLVTARLPVEDLYRSLVAVPERLARAGIASVTRIGDALAPATIFHAVYSGHRYARELEEPAVEMAFRRERIALED